MNASRIDTVIVGGGQAGLVIAVANAWRNERWDSFTLVTPNIQVRMPGAEYDGDDPYGFMPLAQVVSYFDGYVQRFRLPVHCGVEVTSVEKNGEAYLVRISGGDYEAENVVIATGLYQSPRVPLF
jgi:putative flavoprotein involved in K+ transport